MTVNGSWDVIHGWLRQHHPGMLSLLRGPAEAAALGAGTADRAAVAGRIQGVLPDSRRFRR